MDQPPRSVFREYFEALLIAGIFLGFANTFVLKTFYIPSGSMESTMLIGDHLFVDRFIYGDNGALNAVLPSREPRRGDIVIFRSLESPTTDLVKRLVALPGDQVEMKDKELWINGELADDSVYTQHVDPRVLPNRRFLSRQDRLRDNFGPLVVPDDHFFFLGDNRDRSYDSRYWGSVPRHYLKGRASVIYWSYGGETPDGQWRSWGHKLSQLGGTLVGFFTKTRWDRTFHLPR